MMSNTFWYFNSSPEVIRLAVIQGARMWELRAAMSLARHLTKQGKAERAFELLSPVYGELTEGFGTADLREARAVLDELQPLA